MHYSLLVLFWVSALVMKGVFDYYVLWKVGGAVCAWGIESVGLERSPLCVHGGGCVRLGVLCPRVSLALNLMITNTALRPSSLNRLPPSSPPLS